DRDGPLEVCEILRIGMQTACGLAAAHAQGLIHRDVKPSNIMLDEGTERALLTDFGLARAEDDACLTRSGFHPGTPHYMSPEQVRGEAIDNRSDLFGLGCVLYALCAGHPPFRAATSYAVLRRITDDKARPIRELNPGIPAWLEQIVMRLLAKSKEDRFESAAVVSDLLEKCLAHAQAPTSKPLPTSTIVHGQRNDGRTSTWKWIGATFVAFSLMFTALLVVLESEKGTLRIESEADDVSVRIKRGEEVVESMTLSTSGESVRVAAGEYVIEFDRYYPNIQLDTHTVSLSRGGRATVRITRSDVLAAVEDGDSIDAGGKLFDVFEEFPGLAPDSRFTSGKPKQASQQHDPRSVNRRFRPKSREAVSSEIQRIVSAQMEIARAIVHFRLSQTDANGSETKAYRVFLEGNKRRADLQSEDADELTILTPELGIHHDKTSGVLRHQSRDSGGPVGWRFGPGNIPDVRKLGLVCWLPEVVEQYAFDDHLSLIDRRGVSVVQERKGELDVTVVKYFSSRGGSAVTTEYWLSSTHDNRPVYMKRRSAGRSSDSTLTIEQHTDWRDYDGTWFPERIEFDYKYGDTIRKHVTLQTLSAGFGNVIFPGNLFSPKTSKVRRASSIKSEASIDTTFDSPKPTDRKGEKSRLDHDTLRSESFVQRMRDGSLPFRGDENAFAAFVDQVNAESGHPESARPGLNAHRDVVLFFESKSSTLSQRFVPMVDALQDDGYPIERIDIDRNPKLAIEYGITKTPAMTVLRQGKEVAHLIGGVPDQVARRFIENEVALFDTVATDETDSDARSKQKTDFVPSGSE
ncbi:MAG: protein kinase, partial [Planctomycetota bacterium]